MLCYEDDANECETKNWLELKIEGKFWGATHCHCSTFVIAP